MKLPRRFFLLALIVCALPTSLRAEQIFLKSDKNPINGTIKSENSLGVVVDGRPGVIPAGDIFDIQYNVTSANYLAARAKEKELFERTKSEKGFDRYTVLVETKKAYSDAFKELDATQKEAKRNIEFRIALLNSRFSIEFNKYSDTALQNLSDFKTKHKDSWQYTQCLQLLASMQMAQGKFADAEKTYTELSQSSVPAEVKLEAELQAVQVNLRTGNYAQALPRLQALSTKVPKNSKVALQIIGSQAECLAATKKMDEANKLLKQLIKDSPDRNIKALGHNTLGKIYYDQGLLKEARWEFLWVDVIYNQDKAEQAKALYFLTQIFEKLGEPDRAKECRETLLNDRQFAGLDFQIRAKAEEKK